MTVGDMILRSLRSQRLFSGTAKESLTDGCAILTAGGDAQVETVKKNMYGNNMRQWMSNLALLAVVILGVMCLIALFGYEV